MPLTPEQEEHRKKIFAAIAAGEPFERDDSIPLETMTDVFCKIVENMSKLIEELLDAVKNNDVEKIDLLNTKLSICIQAWKVMEKK